LINLFSTDDNKLKFSDGEVDRFNIPFARLCQFDAIRIANSVYNGANNNDLIKYDPRFVEISSGIEIDRWTYFNNTWTDGHKYLRRGVFKLLGKGVSDNPFTYGFSGYKNKIYKKVSVDDFIFGDVSNSLDISVNPLLLTDKENATRLAYIYWDANKINSLADNNDIQGISKMINGNAQEISIVRDLIRKFTSLLNRQVKIYPQTAVLKK
jgi:hypothetical protein